MVTALFNNSLDSFSRKKLVSSFKNLRAILILIFFFAGVGVFVSSSIGTLVSVGVSSGIVPTSFSTIFEARYTSHVSDLYNGRIGSSSSYIPYFLPRLFAHDDTRGFCACRQISSRLSLLLSTRSGSMWL